MCFDDFHTQELDNRVATAWRKFNLLRHELTSKTYPLKSPLRLFEGTITPTVLYGCTAWTLTKDMVTKLQRAQRRMIRMVIGTPRRHNGTPRTHTSQTSPTSNDDGDATNSDSDDQSTDDVASTSNEKTIEKIANSPDEDDMEPWPDFIKRTTRIAEETINKFAIEEWTVLLYNRNWRWASRIAYQSQSRWSHLATQWEPEIHDKRCKGRRQARPRKRWDDELKHFLISNLRRDTDNNNEQTVDENSTDNDDGNTTTNNNTHSKSNNDGDDNNHNHNHNNNNDDDDKDNSTHQQRNDNSCSSKNASNSNNNTYSAHWLQLACNDGWAKMESSFLEFILGVSRSDHQSQTELKRRALAPPTPPPAGTGSDDL